MYILYIDRLSITKVLYRLTHILAQKIAILMKIHWRKNQPHPQMWATFTDRYRDIMLLHPIWEEAIF